MMNAAIDLLKKLVATPSFSSMEEDSLKLLRAYFKEYRISYNLYKNNIWAVNKYFDKNKPNILLNSHHDTVQPNSSYTIDPFSAIEKNGAIYGLGSNDAGASVVSLLSAFKYFYNKKALKYNLIIAITAEEETSGADGLVSLLDYLPPIDFAIVGEPTQMNLAVAEKGLLVLKIFAKGISGHAAHKNTLNPIYLCVDDILWFRDYKFSKVSDFLGEVKMSVSQINAGKQHNVIPAECEMVVDIRVNDCYTNEELLEIVKSNIKNTIKTDINLAGSSIDVEHPIVKAGKDLGREVYGSPTLSDQSVLKCPSLKMGPGDSTRSHQADEYILIEEIQEGIELYIKMLEKVLIC